MADKPLVELIEHPEGYYEAIFHDGSRDAVAMYIDMVEKLILHHLEAQDTARLLINLSEGKMPPIAALSQQARRMLQQHRQDREKLHMRGAFLATSDEALILTLAQSFIKLMPIDANMQTFTTEHRAKAIVWLLEDNDG